MLPLGTVGILTGRGPACDELQAWLDTLPAPPHVQRCRVPGNQIAWQRDFVAGQLRPSDTFLLFVDADCVPPTGALERLLSHDLPLVGGACPERTEPFEVCAVRQLEPYDRYRALDLARRGPEPFPVVSLGTGFLLIRPAVLRALERPWFRCGQVHPALLAEDLDFCLRAAEVGFPPYLDPTVRVGHLVSSVVRVSDQVHKDADGAEHGMLEVQWPVPTGRAPYWRPFVLWED